MNRELEKKLVDKYPNLLRHYRNDPKLPMYYGIECGDGWYDLIDKALAVIQEEANAYTVDDDRFVVHQIKEKFGSLRLYMSDEVGRMKEAINDAYKESLITCVWCGVKSDEVKQNEHSFVRSMCPQCMIEYARNGWNLNGEF